MSQENRFAVTDGQQQQVESVKAGQEERFAATNLAGARILPDANKPLRDANEPFEEEL